MLGEVGEMEKSPDPGEAGEMAKSPDAGRSWRRDDFFQ